MEQSGLLKASTFKLEREHAAVFAKKNQQFASLIDAISTGDSKTTLEICNSVGISEKQASLLIRDSAALAAFVNAVGAEAGW
jgi:hypothetical protein